MVLIVRFLFSFLISTLPTQTPHMTQIPSHKELTTCAAIFTFARQTGVPPNLGCRRTAGPEPAVLAPRSITLPLSDPVASASPACIAHTAFAFPTPQSFWIPTKDIIGQGYNLSINRYKEVQYEEVEHRAPQVILHELESIVKESIEGMKQPRGMLN